MARDRTSGNEAKLIFCFTLPIIAGNFLQQLYNTADSMVVGAKLGEAALSAVGACAPALGVDRLRFMAPVFLIFAAYLSITGVLNGAGDVIMAATITLSSLFTRVGITYILAYFPLLGYPSVYYATPFGWALCITTAILRYRGGKWREKAVVKETTARSLRRPETKRPAAFEEVLLWRTCIPTYVISRA